MKKETKYWELTLERFREEYFEAKDIIAAAKYARKSADACYKGKEAAEILGIRQLTKEEYISKVKEREEYDRRTNAFAKAWQDSLNKK